MAFCTACGSNVPDEVNYCPICGGAMTSAGQNAPSVEKHDLADILQPQTAADAIETPSAAPPVPEAPAPYVIETPPPVQQAAPYAAAPMNTNMPGAYGQPAPYAAAAPGYNAQTGQPPPNYAPAHAYPADIRPPKTSQYAQVGVLNYIGLMILYAIPLIGWISCIIMAFAARNRNIRNYARAVLILTIIGIILAVIGYVTVAWVFMEMLDGVQGFLL